MIPEQDHVAMHFLGNAIAVPHAIWAMAHGLQCFTVVKQVDPVESVHQAHHLRIKSDACALLRIQHGWLLTSLKQLSSLLAHRSLRLQIEGGLRVHNAEFHRVDVIPLDPELETLEIFFCAHLRPEEAIQAFGLSCDDTVQPEPNPSQQFVWTVTLDSAPVLRLPVGKDRRGHVPKVVCVLTPRGAICVSRTSPDQVAQVRYVFDWACDVPGEPVWCHDFFGRPLRELHSLPPIMLVTPQGDDVLFPHVALAH